MTENAEKNLAYAFGAESKASVRNEAFAWKADDKGLTLKTLPGTLWGATNTAKNLLLRAAPDKGDFATEVKLSVQPALDGEQAGLVWYAGDGNYIKLVKEFKGQPFLILVREEQDTGKEIGRIPAPEGTVTLRLASRNGWVTAQGRAVGAPGWQKVAECAGLRERALQVGILTHISPGETGRSARFQNFRLLREQ